MNDTYTQYKDHPVYKRLMASGPKRILSLDGGGIRGALTIGYLEEIETLLRQRFDDQNLVLADYFDLVGGTSTGSIIATLISLGKAVEEIKAFYLKLGPKIFTKRNSLLNWGYFKYFLNSEFDPSFFEEELEKELGNLTLGAEELQTGLAIFAKRADTFSIWNIHNHPVNAYYERNKGIYLKDLIRASCAAPSYFTPKEIKFSDGESAIFVDGGVSLVNNPGLMLFLMATISGYGYQWKTGADNLQIISVGTGSYQQKTEGAAKDKIKKRNALSWAPLLSDIFMTDAAEQNQFLLQYFSRAHLPEKINSEAGDLSKDLITDRPLLDYCRYNVSIDTTTLATLGKHLKEEQVVSLRKMEIGENAQELYEIGSLHAKSIVSESHFRDVFDFGLADKKDTIYSQEQAKELFLPIIEAKEFTYKKIKGVIARVCKQSEEITSITSDGIETSNTATVGDYIVKNKTESAECYVIRAEKFPTLYEHVKDVDEVWADYSPLGKVEGIELYDSVMKELKLDSHFHIIASWGEPQYVKAGDFLVRPHGKSEIYRIGRDEFKQTYKEL